MNEMIDEACEMVDHYSEATWLSQILPPGDMAIGKGPPGALLFHKTRSHLLDDQTAAFSVTLKPHQWNITVDQAAAFSLLMISRRLWMTIMSCSRPMQSAMANEKAYPPSYFHFLMCTFGTTSGCSSFPLKTNVSCFQPALFRHYHPWTPCHSDYATLYL